MMQSRAEEFLEKAIECEERAKVTEQPDLRVHYMELARQWRELADQVKRYGLF